METVLKWIERVVVTARRLLIQQNCDVGVRGEIVSSIVREVDETLKSKDPVPSKAWGSIEKSWETHSTWNAWEYSTGEPSHPAQLSHQIHNPFPNHIPPPIKSKALHQSHSCVESHINSLVTMG